MKRFLNKIHYSESLNYKEKALKGLLSGISVLYHAGSNIRNFLYSKDILKKTKLPAFVISIGNLTTGGTGKTPLTIEIANYIQNYLNKNTAILSHGYGGQLPTKAINVISDGKTIYHAPHDAGDEPYLMATKLQDVAVLTGKSRINSGKHAIENFGAEVLILDDGFQHIKLERDLNILVIDCNKKFGNNQLLPAGPLRESIEEIKRADKIVVVNKKPYDANVEKACSVFIENLKAKYNKPVYLCRFTNGEIYNIKTSEVLNSPVRAYAITGIAQPEFFFNYLQKQNIDVAISKEFTDHHLYTRDDLKNIFTEAKKLEIEAIITTEKDAVKLASIIDKVETEIPIFALKLDIEIDLSNLVISIT
ncbi:MAG: tetraacyldisaccharide 4'-kinase [Candidatus Melainabacteria bacterium RIFOXYA12_FULL_32_12]|nr:MAG: tetraacyldisaccharide 4'-kinase [Candidatus Melainabacteria bacterium RIFOXYA2_FULL_32_9]OGI31396.1 MAG: tetraacyldisaccharide 4'-kinase [Candidatus Melainabacteria bacterium RIFOXYA12_FULL_32_12]